MLITLRSQIDLGKMSKIVLKIIFMLPSGPWMDFISNIEVLSTHFFHADFDDFYLQIKFASMKCICCSNYANKVQ